MVGLQKEKSLREMMVRLGVREEEIVERFIRAQGPPPGGSRMSIKFPLACICVISLRELKLNANRSAPSLRIGIAPGSSYLRRLSARSLESFLKSKSVSRRYAGRNEEGLAGQN